MAAITGPTYTFDPSLGSAKDRIRFVIGDIDVLRNKLIADETIEAILVLKGDERTAAIACCESLEASFAQFTESRAGETMADRTAVSNKYRDLAKRLRKVSVAGFAVLTQSQRDLYDADLDRLKNAARTADFSNPGAESTENAR